MKSRLFLLWFFVLLPFFAFSEEYEKAVKRAFEERKPLILYFFSPDCYYCEKMEKEVFSDKTIREIIKKKIVFSKIQMEKRQDLVRRYGIFGSPTILLLDPSGKRIGFIPGYIEKETFRKIIDYLIAERYKSQSLYDYLFKD